MVTNKKYKECRNFPNKEISKYHEFEKISNPDCSWNGIMPDVKFAG